MMTTPTMLPKSVRPSTYDLTLCPNLDDFTFWGEESIDVSIMSATSEIVMNCDEIEIRDAKLTIGDSRTIEASSIDFDTEAETVRLTFADEPTRHHSR